MQPTYVQRLQLTFSKIGPTRFIGHLDLARTWERILNRATLPMTYSQGFNRRPKMQMATALPLGFTSDCEMIEIWLDERLELDEVQARLTAKMAPGIVLHHIHEVDLQAPLLQNITLASVFHVTLLDPMDREVLQGRIEALLASESFMRARERGRKQKPYDLRPLIYDLQLEPTESETPTILMNLKQVPNTAAGRPDEVLYALEIDPADARIHRTEIVFDEKMMG